MLPLYHDFADETVVVFGGGPIGARKARRFDTEARVIVVSPAFDADDFGDAARAGRGRCRPPHEVALAELGCRCEFVFIEHIHQLRVRRRGHERRVVALAVGVDDLVARPVETHLLSLRDGLAGVVEDILVRYLLQISVFVFVVSHL